MKQLQLPRKLFHIINGCVLLCFYIFLEKYRQEYIYGLFIAFIFSIIGVFLIRKYPQLTKYVQSLIRKDNPIIGIGVPMYLGGVITTLLAHYYYQVPLVLVVCAISTLAIGDGIATIAGKSSIGKIFGPKTYPKSYMGLIAGIVFSMLFSMLLVHLFEIPNNIYEMLIVCSFGMCVEFLLTSKFAHEYCIDNLVIPIVIICLGIVII